MTIYTVVNHNTEVNVYICALSYLDLHVCVCLCLQVLVSFYVLV